MWVPKPSLSLVFVLIGVVVVLAAASLFLLKPRGSACDLQLGQACITLERADTPAARSRGLSGRANLAADRAMLFVHDRPVRECFWMKDMHFALDMVWLDATRHIFKVEENVSPDTYPRSFCPDQGAQYVLELPAGSVRRHGLAHGQQLAF